MPYESYVRKKSKNMPTDSCFYLSRHLAKFMMSHLRGSVRTQKMSNLRGWVRTQDMSTQNMSNLRGCYMDKIKSKIVNVN